MVACTALDRRLGGSCFLRSLSLNMGGRVHQTTELAARFAPQYASVNAAAVGPHEQPNSSYSINFAGINAQPYSVDSTPVKAYIGEIPVDCAPPRSGLSHQSHEIWGLERL